jgi:hypothetical protein
LKIFSFQGLGPGSAVFTVVTPGIKHRVPDTILLSHYNF